MPYNIRIISDVDEYSLRKLMERIGVHPEGIKRMIPKSRHFLIFLENVDFKAAHILKQEILGIGGDAAVSSGISNFTDTITDILLMGTYKQLSQLVKKLELQPFGLKSMAEELNDLLDNFSNVNRILRCGDYVFDLSKQVLLMGILNVTSDSFSDGNLYLEPERAIDRAFEIVEEGADILDIGAESTRPGASEVSETEERERLLPVLEKIVDKVPVPISVDTYKYNIAKLALDHGVCMINDVTALRHSPGIAELVAQNNAAIVIMHMKGTPRNMQIDPRYDDVNGEITGFLRERALFAENEGIKPDRIIIDPGIGFGKTVAHNLEILANLPQYRSLGKPVLVGPSRKSFIGKILNREVKERLAGTSSVVATCAYGGADIIRVHDVGFMKQVVQMAKAIRDYPYNQATDVVY